MSAYYRVNFELANNEDLRQGFALTDDAAAAIDLTGAVLAMDIETASGQGVLEASSQNGRIVISNASQGRFDLAVPAAVMRTLPHGCYVHDLLLTSVDGSVRRLWTGTLTLAQGVTG